MATLPPTNEAAPTRRAEAGDSSALPQLSSLQVRTLRTLVSSQILGGMGIATGIAVMSLLALELSGSETLAGFGTTFQVLGGAVIAIPVSRLMAARGRRPGLMLGYAVALAGALIVVLAAQLGSFALMLVGSFLVGGGTTSNSQARYAAADLAAPRHRGRDLSIVVWATTIGSVAGPNLVSPIEAVTGQWGLPSYGGAFLGGALGFAGAIVILHTFLRPDPLTVAQSAAFDEPEARPPATRSSRGTFRDGVRSVLAHRGALLGLVTMALGHGVMIAVMVMTPIHMTHGNASLRLVGLVISVHILGMYALSPLTGLAVDRLGGRAVAITGSLILMGASLLASTSQPGMSPLLAVALFTLGLGWSCTLVAGSTLLVNALPVAERPTAQGFADFAMGMTGALTGALAGVVLGTGGYPVLALGGAVIAGLITLAAVLIRPPRA